MNKGWIPGGPMETHIARIKRPAQLWHESHRLRVALCHKLDWASRETAPRIERILERARARYKRRRQSLEQAERPSNLI